MLTTGKIRDTGHRFQKYVYDPFNESDKTHCYICEYLQPNALPVRKGLKCFYCGYTIHPMCQLFVTRKCKKKEQEELEELINTQQRPKHSIKHDKEARKSKIILQPPDTTQPPPESKVFAARFKRIFKRKEAKDGVRGKSCNDLDMSGVV